MTGTKRVLFVGGTGTISAACVHRAVAAGHDVTVVNRGTARRALPAGAHSAVADIRAPGSVREALRGQRFDVVADFLSYTPADVASALDLFEDGLEQYLFISTASAYEKPPRRLPVSESTLLRNPFSPYAQNKIACEDALLEAFRSRGLPVTVVRPSHTYDGQLAPTLGRWTDIARMRAGKPVIVPGDGTNPWTITHASDFAVAFTALLGNPAAIGEAFTVTGDHAPTWNRIYGWLAEAAGVPDAPLVHVASDTIVAFEPSFGPTLLGDKSHPGLFDASKIRALAPEFRTTIGFDQGAREIVAHFDATPELQIPDPQLDALFDRIAAHAAVS